MKIKHWIHERVQDDGTVLDDYGKPNGNVEIVPVIKMSEDEGGCGLENCTCSEGHWISINKGLHKETTIVEGMTVFFDNWGEMKLFFATKELAG